MIRRVPVLIALTAALVIAGGCSRSPAVERLEWPVMGTIAAVQHRGAAAAARRLAAQARADFAALEKLLNRFDPDSELSRLAGLSDAEVLARCDARVRPCYAAAFRLRDESGGAFDPRWRGRGTLDLGAIAKGFALDAAAKSAGSTGDGGKLLLDLGGNLKVVRGEWKTAVAASDLTLTLTNGMAAATSAEYFRGKHIIDARTGNAVTNGFKSVTVVHPTSAMLADGLSTVCFLLGEADGEALLKKHHPEARAYWNR